MSSSSKTRKRWPVGIIEEAIECKPQRQTFTWLKVVGSLVVAICLGFGCQWWQARASSNQAKLKQLTAELTRTNSECERWRKYSDQQDRNAQLEILRCRETTEKHGREIGHLKLELSRSHEHSENWRRYSEQQVHDLRREVTRRRKAEERMFETAPEAYQEQLRDLSNEMAMTQRLHEAQVQRHQHEVHDLKLKLQTVSQNCEEWRSHAEAGKRNLALEIQQSKEAWQRYSTEVGQLKSELGSAQEDSQNWQRQVKRQERDAHAFRVRIKELESESLNLKKQLRRSPGRLALSCEQLAEQIAESECRPLNKMSTQARQAFKKKLLIKWHPDKQPSADHVALATSVMQALQNRSEWDS